MKKIKEFIKGYFVGEYRSVFWLTVLFAGYILLYFLFLYSKEAFSHPWVIILLVISGIYVPIDDWLFRENKIRRDYLFVIKCLIYLPIVFSVIYLTGGYSSDLLPAVYLTVMTIPLYGNNLESQLGITLVSSIFIMMYITNSNFSLNSAFEIKNLAGLFVYIISFYSISGAIRSFVAKMEKRNEELAIIHKQLDEKNNILEKDIQEYIKKLKDQNKILERKINQAEKLNAATVGRELKMIELKKKISELEGRNEA